MKIIKNIYPIICHLYSIHYFRIVMDPQIIKVREKLISQLLIKIIG